MKLLHNYRLKAVAEYAGLTIAEAETKIMQYVRTTDGWDEENDDLFGLTLAQVLTLEESLDLARILGFDLSVEAFAAMQAVTLMGEGDCPHCGGILECVDGEYEVRGDGYYEEREYKPIWEVYRCTNCRRYENTGTIME